MEAECELLVDGVIWVDQDMGGVAVDTGEPNELDGDAGLLSDFTHNGVARGLADLDPTSGQLPVAVVRRTSKSSPALLRTVANAAGRTSCAVGLPVPMRPVLS